MPSTPTRPTRCRKDQPGAVSPTPFQSGSIPRSWPLFASEPSATIDPSPAGSDLPSNTSCPAPPDRARSRDSSVSRSKVVKSGAGLLRADGSRLYRQCAARTSLLTSEPPRAAMASSPSHSEPPVRGSELAVMDEGDDGAVGHVDLLTGVVADPEPGPPGQRHVLSRRRGALRHRRRSRAERAGCPRVAGGHDRRDHLELGLVARPEDHHHPGRHPQPGERVRDAPPLREQVRGE